MVVSDSKGTRLLNSPPKHVTIADREGKLLDNCSRQLALLAVHETRGLDLAESVDECTRSGLVAVPSDFPLA